MAITAKAPYLFPFLILKSIGSSVYIIPCSNKAVVYKGIWHPIITIQYQSFYKASGVSGIPNDSTATIIKLKLMIMLVEVPKPLSIKSDGTVSSIAFGVVQINTPHEKPNTNLPKHMI